MQVPGDCKNFEKCGSTDWRDDMTSLCRQCEIDAEHWGHEGTKAENGKQIQEDNGLAAP